VKKRYYEQKRREHLTLGDEASDSKTFKLQQPSAGSRWAAAPVSLRSAFFTTSPSDSLGVASVWVQDDGGLLQFFPAIFVGSSVAMGAPKVKRQLQLIFVLFREVCVRAHGCVMVFVCACARGCVMVFVCARARF
jgi:hypothetical protein